MKWGWMDEQNKSGLKVIFLIVFLYLVGFGVIIPLLPVLSREMGASAFEIGLLMSIYSLMQFIFSPFWGRLSDRSGRRPILLFCLLGETLSYLIFAFSRSVEMLIVARALAGFFGASISTASAAISDLTPPNERSKGMALIGMAFGLGFIVGPALGGGLSILGEHFSQEKFFSSTFTLVGVSLLCFITLLLAIKILPETYHGRKSESSGKGRLLRLYADLGRPTIGGLIFVFFLTGTAMSCMEATLSLFAFDRFGWGIKEVSFGFAYIGVLSTFNQGFLVRRLLPKLGERKVLTMGVVLLGLGFTLIGFSTNLVLLGAAVTLIPFGLAFTNPSILGSVSLLSSKDEQGRILGTTQGTAALGRIIGPLLGGFVYENINISAPFWASGLIVCAGFLLVLKLGSRIPHAAKTTETKNADAPTPLGFFQFENLIRNRVPFTLITWDCDFSNWYSGVEKMHLEKVSRAGEKLAHILSELERDPTQPIVLVCKNGDTSAKAAADLQRQGFKNVFVVAGGYHEMERQRQT